jgi:hypothetical protein
VSGKSGRFLPLVASAQSARGHAEASQVLLRKRPASARSPTAASTASAGASRSGLSTAPSPYSPSLVSPQHKKQDAKLSPSSAAAMRMQCLDDDYDVDSLEKDVDGMSPDLLQRCECVCCMRVLIVLRRVVCVYVCSSHLSRPSNTTLHTAATANRFIVGAGDEDPEGSGVGAEYDGWAARGIEDKSDSALSLPAIVPGKQCGIVQCLVFVHRPSM